MDTTPSRHTTRNGRAAILVAAVAWSLAGLGQRGLDATPATQVAGRALFAFLALLVVVAVTERSGIIRSFRALGRDDKAFFMIGDEAVRAMIADYFVSTFWPAVQQAFAQHTHAITKADFVAAVALTLLPNVGAADPVAITGGPVLATGAPPAAVTPQALPDATAATLAGEHLKFPDNP